MVDKRKLYNNRTYKRNLRIDQNNWTSPHFSLSSLQKFGGWCWELSRQTLSCSPIILLQSLSVPCKSYHSTPARCSCGFLNLGVFWQPPLLLAVRLIPITRWLYSDGVWSESRPNKMEKACRWNGHRFFTVVNIRHVELAAAVAAYTQHKYAGAGGRRRPCSEWPWPLCSASGYQRKSTNQLASNPSREQPGARSMLLSHIKVKYMQSVACLRADSVR